MPDYEALIGELCNRYLRNVPLLPFPELPQDLAYLAFVIDRLRANGKLRSKIQTARDNAYARFDQTGDDFDSGYTTALDWVLFIGDPSISAAAEDSHQSPEPSDQAH